MKPEQLEREELNLDIWMLVGQIWKKKILLFLSFLLFTVIAVLISLVVLTPQYKSTAKIYIINQSEGTGLTIQDLQTGKLLIQDYQEIILSDTVLDLVGREMNLTASDLRKKVEIASPRDNRILSITARDKNPEKAAEIANKLKEKSIEKIKEITKVKDITTIDEAKVPFRPYTPNVKKNGALGGIFGFLLALACIILKELLDDRVKNPEDVEQILNQTLLGVLPKSDRKRKKYGNR